MKPRSTPKSPPLPHERARDPSSGQAARDPDPQIEQAARDLADGQVDTDMRATPGLDSARRQRMVPTPVPDPGAAIEPPKRDRRDSKPRAKRRAKGA